MAPPEQETKAEGADDQSMEDILHSIKKIIADDGDEVKPEKAKSNGKSEKPAEKDVKSAKDKGDSEEVPGSDVLELTEVVEDEPPAKAAAEEKPEKKEKPAEKPAEKDVLQQIDEAVKPAVAAKPKEEAPKKAEAPPAPAPAAAPPAPKPAAAPGDPMLSESAEAATRASVEKLKKSSEPPPLVTTDFPEFTSGGSLEDIVAGMVRPMIKEWLDKNLPAIVERIVEQEIKRITR